MSGAANPGDQPGLLLVEDVPSMQMLYQMVLNKAGFPPICAQSGAEALELFRKHLPGVVLLDLMLPDMDGMSLIRQILTLAPKTRIIVITADGSIDKAIEATRQGAHDFLVKPLGDQRMIAAVRQAMTNYRGQIRTTADDLSLVDLGPVLRLGTSALSEQLRQQIAAVARSMAPVFIIGERGSGKKTVARMIHSDSARATGPFVAVNCALIDPVELSVRIFGSGGFAGKTGALQEASGGTLLIENPQDMPMPVQEALQKVLHSGQVTTPDKAGATALDLRLICSARHHPAEDMRAGTLSEDLYYRLVVLPVHLPPLRDRPDDILACARYLIDIIARQEGKRFTRIAADAAEILTRRSWPGNLRELMNVLRQAVVLHDGPELTEAMLPDELKQTSASRDMPVAGAMSMEDAMAGLTMAEIERRAVEAALARHGGSVPRAARELDIAPSTIYRKRDAWTKPDT